MAKARSSRGAPTPAPAPTPTSQARQPLSLHTLHLIALLGVLQPGLLLLSVLYLPQRAALGPLPSSDPAPSSSLFGRAFNAVAALYDDPERVPGEDLVASVLPAASLAIFVTQAWLTRALGKWIASERLRTQAASSTDKAAKVSKAASHSTWEQLALSILSLPLSTAIFLTILFGLLGAPIPFTQGLSTTLATLGLAFHLALLVALPASHTLGTDTALWDVVYLPAPASPNSPNAASGLDDKAKKRRRAQEAWHAVLFYPAAGALLGAITGSYGLALDWGRPWQTWPLPPLLGSTAGLVLGNWLGIRAWTTAAWSAHVAT